MTSKPILRQDPASWEAGYRAGLAGKSGMAPPGCDGLAYASRLIEGLADRDKPLEQRRAHPPRDRTPAP
jgi:hypothetical protein